MGVVANVEADGSTIDFVSITKWLLKTKEDGEKNIIITNNTLQKIEFDDLVGVFILDLYQENLKKT